MSEAAVLNNLRDFGRSLLVSKFPYAIWRAKPDSFYAAGFPYFLASKRSIKIDDNFRDTA
jgi:hypothetical protein